KAGTRRSQRSTGVAEEDRNWGEGVARTLCGPTMDWRPVSRACEKARGANPIHSPSVPSVALCVLCAPVFLFSSPRPSASPAPPAFRLFRGAHGNFRSELALGALSGGWPWGTERGLLRPRELPH